MQYRVIRYLGQYAYQVKLDNAKWQTVSRAYNSPTILNRYFCLRYNYPPITETTPIHNLTRLDS